MWIVENDIVCSNCLQQLKYCYQFHDTILSNLAAIQKMPTVQSMCAPEDVSNRCTICEACFESKLELERHLKLFHPSPKNPSYHCKPCDKSFKTNRGMLQHKTMYHDSSEAYMCQICDRHFITKTNYENHMRYHQDFLCNFCNACWVSERTLLDHVRAAHLDRFFVCRFCDRTERLKKCLNRHLRTSHQQESNPYYCGHCAKESMVYDSFEAAIEHVQDKHTHDEDINDHSATTDGYEGLLNGSIFSKELPQLDFQDTDELVKEQEQFLQNLQLTRNYAKEKASPAHQHETRIDRRVVLEDFLDEAFENDEIWEKYIENGEEYLIDDYDIYLQGMDGTGSQPNPCMYRCPKCDRGFQKQIHLTVHLAEEHDMASLVCNDCEASFTRLHAYRAHRKEHLKENVRFRESNIPEMEEALSLVQNTPVDYSVQEEENGYRFICKLCDRTFQRKHNLEKHHCRFYEQLEQESDATSKKHQQCPHCDFRSHSGKDLYLHQKTHHNASSINALSPENIYCMLCDRRFSSTSGLKYHMKRHTGIKAFTCMYCGKKFTANTNLNAHIRNVHSEQKAHRCTECGEAFATKDHLNKHERSRHRQDRAFVCSECGKSYYQRSHLNEHIAASHRECRYMCQVCNSSYVSRSSLKRHQLLKHS
ncbi:gastrula zinc finger protein xFG20-1-like [Anopheles ziemanni]|nr:gastrula zinc finger protein xFG20-1-like [Anopheles ziemanni]